jgi:hypothetical protein
LSGAIESAFGEAIVLHQPKLSQRQELRASLEARPELFDGINSGRGSDIEYRTDDTRFFIQLPNGPCLNHSRVSSALYRVEIQDKTRDAAVIDNESTFDQSHEIKLKGRKSEGSNKRQFSITQEDREAEAPGGFFCSPYPACSIQIDAPRPRPLTRGTDPEPAH